MCIGGGGPSKAANDQAAENERLAEKRRQDKRAALQNPEDLLAKDDSEKKFQNRGRRGLTIGLDSTTESENTSGLSIKS
jgi:hypothetical protein